MARISSYPYDTTVTDNDAWIGTEASNRQTKQFTASAVANYLNLNAKVNIGGQMSFKWSDTENAQKLISKLKTFFPVFFEFYELLKKYTNGNQYLVIIGVSVYMFFEIFGYRIRKELWDSGNTPLLILYYSPLVLISLYLFYNYQKGLNKKNEEQEMKKNREGEE